MSKSLLLTIHRWTALVFALPLLAVIVTGLVLSFEPAFQLAGTRAHAIDAESVIAAIRRYDPQARARGLSLDAAAQRLSLQGPNMPDIDLATGQPAAAKSATSALFRWARFNHERLIGQPWLVIASTCAMVAIMSLGILMGWPRLRNSLSGWHKGAAWFGLPLILLSPLTGLCMAFGLTFQGGPHPAAAARPISLPDAVRSVASFRDLAQVTSIGIRGGRMMARIFEGGELRAYAITADGMNELGANWPRSIHEGNWSAMAGTALNAVTSAILLGLLSTGLLLWVRRKWRRPLGRRSEGQPRQAARGSLA
jgi:uncharacterized iron-regulated membrane protein